MTGAIRRAAPQDADEDDVPEPPSAPSDASLAPAAAADAALPADDAFVAALQADAAEFDAWLAAGKSAYKSIVFSRGSSGPEPDFDHAGAGRPGIDQAPRQTSQSLEQLRQRWP
jgi:hypothetical protein